MKSSANLVSVICLSLFPMAVASANDFSFDRPGAGAGTGITPVGRLSWEQSLPTFEWSRTKEPGDNRLTRTYSTDVVLRTGLAEQWEVQIGWDGFVWARESYNGYKRSDNGAGDTMLGVKYAIDTSSDQLALALLGEVHFASGHSQFRADDDLYSLTLAAAYALSDTYEAAITLRADHSSRHSALTLVPALGYAFNDVWSGFSEIIIEKWESESVNYEFATGIVRSINANAQIDLSVGTGLGLGSGEREYTAGIGFGYLF